MLRKTPSSRCRLSLLEDSIPSYKGNMVTALLLTCISLYLQKHADSDACCCAAASAQQRKVCVRNAAPEEILKQAIMLHSSIGRDPGRRIQERVVSSQKSIQSSLEALEGSKSAKQMQQHT